MDRKTRSPSRQDPRDDRVMIRKFTLGDLPADVSTYNEAEAGNPDFRRFTPEDFRKHLLEDPHYQPEGHFVAVKDGLLVASARAGFHPEIAKVRGPEACFRIHVIPSYLGKPVEKEIFGKVADYLRSRGAEWIVTRVDTRYTAMVGLLERLGFTKSDYQNHGMERETQGVTEPEVPGGYRIRAADIPDEVEVLHGVMTEAFSTRVKFVPMPLSRFRRHQVLEDPGNFSGILLAERIADGKPVGMIMSAVDREFNAERNTRRGTSYALSVLPPERKRGLGTALLMKSARWIGSKGMDTAYLSVNVSNLDALGIYQKAGYKTVQVYQGYRISLA